MFGSGLRLGVGFFNPASPGWGLGWVCLGMVCGVVPLVSAVCGVRGWASVAACLWDVCGFVRAPLAPRRFRVRRAVWACVLGPGLGCAPPFLAGLSKCVLCPVVFLFFFVGCWVSLSRALWSLSPHPLSFGLGCWLFFFFGGEGLHISVSLFLLGRYSWLGVAGFGWVVPLCLSGGPVFGAFLGGGFGRLWWCWRAVWWLWAVFAPPPLPPLFFFFWGGGCLFLPLPSLGLRTHWPAFSVVFRAAVGGCVLFGRVPAPWVRWAMYTLGSAPLLAGLGPGSASWAAAPGGCVRLWVRGLGLFVPFPLCGAGFNLLGGQPLLLPGALWPRVWPAVPVCGVLVRRLPGCAVACFG